MAKNKNDDSVLEQHPITDEQDAANRAALAELENEELRAQIKRMEVQAALTAARHVAPLRPPSNEDSDPQYDPNGHGDDLIRVEAIKFGTYYDIGNTNRPEWYTIGITGRERIGGVTMPGRVFMMRRADVNTAMFDPKKGTGWVRVLRPGEEVRPDQPIGVAAPQTTQQNTRVRAAGAGNILSIGG